MLSLSAGRISLVLAVCLATAFFVSRIQYQSGSGTYSDFGLDTQYSQSSKKSLNGIGNDTLGFEKIFVINAPWRTDRKDSVSLAASYSGLSLTWVDGVDPENMREKAYPPGSHRDLSDGLKGCWRAHMNALREVVERNLTTALILEDDADWDFRIRSQLSSISAGVRKIPSLIVQSEQHPLKHPPSTENEHVSQIELAKRSSFPMPLLPNRAVPKHDPYGRDWDILWLGHCGANLPPPSPHSPDRVMLANDITVPQPQHLKPMAHAPLDALSTIYPPHTRLIHRANTTSCATAYAVTQAGARKLLFEFGVREFSQGYDFALSDYCNGRTLAQRQEESPLPRCLVVQPPVLGHYFAEKAGSDITGVGGGGKPERETRYVRWSVRMNLERLVRGKEGINQQWVDAL